MQPDLATQGIYRQVRNNKDKSETNIECSVQCPTLRCAMPVGLVAVENEEPRPVLRPVDENKDGPRPSAEVEATASPTAHGHHDQRTVAAAGPFLPRPDWRPTARGRGHQLVDKYQS